MEGEGYTQDGTVDLKGRPVLASRTGRWKACSFLIVYEAFERMAFCAVAANLVVYLTTQLHEDTVSSVRNVNNWSGAVWLTPILGAYVADTYLGRFWTFTFSSVVYVLGMVLLTLAVSINSHRSSCSNGVCSGATQSQIAFFYTALYVVCLGAGGTKPNISTFGADQFDDFDPREKKLKISFFNWWMFVTFFGGFFAALALVYIQENLGWALGYGIPTAALILSLVVLYLGTPYFRHKVKKTGNPTKDIIIRVLVKAFRNRQQKLPESDADLHEHDHQHYVVTGRRRVHHSPGFRFLDKAALKEASTDAGSSGGPCTVTQVEETKLVLGMAVVWLTTLVPSTIFAQVNTLFVKQGLTLDRRLGNAILIPAASLSGFVTLTVLLAIPLYDRFFVPLMRRRTGNPRGITLLQRLGIGCGIQVLLISVAALVEMRRLSVAKASGIVGPKGVVPMSIFWLLPQYVLMGIGQVFNAVGLLEFFYDQSPEEMQSLGTTFFTSSIGMGNFLNGFLVTVVDRVTAGGGGKSWIGSNLNDSHLDYYYGFLMAISAINLALFLRVSHGYHYKVEATEVTEGRMITSTSSVGTEERQPSGCPQA